MKFIEKYIFLIIIIIFVILVSHCNSSKNNRNEDDSEIRKSALASCRVFISSNLKNPDSAKFSPDPMYKLAIEEIPGRWKVIRKVTAKNSFNADVTSVYVCKMVYDGNNFILESIKIGE
jgi:hypothetical protein